VWRHVFKQRSNLFKQRTQLQPGYD
jgi:hypothetical protein